MSFIIRWWTWLTFILFTSYFYSGDRRPLGEYAWVWYSCRLTLGVTSIAIFIWYKKPWLKELIGYEFAAYCVLVTWSYWLATEDKDNLFQGELVRTICLSGLLIVVAYFSHRETMAFRRELRVEAERSNQNEN